MEAILSSVGLSHLLSKFISNKVGIDDARLLTDENLNQLGVATIGDRIRLRDALNKHFKAGRRHGLTLGRIPCFATAVEEEPPLGFSVLPTITFAERESYLPTSNTCINKLILTIPSRKEEIPEDLNLFDKFDYAFCNVFFGLA